VSGDNQDKVRSGKMACMPQTLPVFNLDSKPCD